MSDLKQPLTVEVDGERLVISIGVEALVTLAFANDELDEDATRVEDPLAFAAAIARGLSVDDGDGLTPIHDAIGEAVTLAIEDGDNGLVFASDDDPSEEL